MLCGKVYSASHIWYMALSQGLTDLQVNGLMVRQCYESCYICGEKIQMYDYMYINQIEMFIEKVFNVYIQIRLCLCVSIIKPLSTSCIIFLLKQVAALT